MPAWDEEDDILDYQEIEEIDASYARIGDLLRTRTSALLQEIRRRGLHDDPAFAELIALEKRLDQEAWEEVWE